MMKKYHHVTIIITEYKHDVWLYNSSNTDDVSQWPCIFVACAMMLFCEWLHCLCWWRSRCNIQDKFLGRSIISLQFVWQDRKNDNERTTRYIRKFVMLLTDRAKWKTMKSAPAYIHILLTITENGSGRKSYKRQF